MPTAATTSGPTSETEVHGSAGLGTPCGRAPTVSTPWLASPTIAEMIVAPTIATNTAGTRRVIRGSTSSTTNAAAPIATAATTV